MMMTLITECFLSLIRSNVQKLILHANLGGLILKSSGNRRMWISISSLLIYLSILITKYNIHSFIVCNLVGLSCLFKPVNLFIVFYTFIDPVDGAWSSWMNWNTCTASCNGGYRSRARSCSSPQPSLGGHLCDGMPSQTEICNTHGCQGLDAGHITEY